MKELSGYLNNNMTYLYNEEGLNQINKEKKTNMWLFALFVFLFVVSTIVFILVSTYETKVVFSIISSVVGSIFVVVAIFFLSKYLYLKRLSFEYETLYTSENKKIQCEILECSSFITTLPDKSKCYEVLIKCNDRESIYYLSNIFDNELIKPGKCLIVVSHDYLKGYQYEN